MTYQVKFSFQNEPQTFYLFQRAINAILNEQQAVMANNEVLVEMKLRHGVEILGEMDHQSIRTYTAVFQNRRDYVNFILKNLR